MTNLHLLKAFPFTLQSHMERLVRHRVCVEPRQYYCEFHRWWNVGRMGSVGLQTLWSQQQREISDGTPQGLQDISWLLRSSVGEDLLQSIIAAHQEKDKVLHWGRDVQEAQKVWLHVELVRPSDEMCSSTSNCLLT